MKALHLAWLLISCFLQALPAQRPKTVAAAVRGFEAVQQQDERNRHAAVRDLGRFAEPEATAILLQELARAATLSYQQTVVRAIGYQQRSGAVGPLAKLLASSDNARLSEAIANAMAKQGDVGVQALCDQLQASNVSRAQQNAICYALGRLTEGDEARDALLRILSRTTGDERLPALRGLEARSQDAQVDRVRIELAADKNTTVAALALAQLAAHGHAEAPALAVALAQRLPRAARADKFAAVMQGLLVAVPADQFATLVAATAKAEDPFGQAKQAGWQRAVANDAFLKWLAANVAAMKEDDQRIVTARMLAYSDANHRQLASLLLRDLLQHRSGSVVQAAATAWIQLDPGTETQAALQILLQKANEVTGPIALGALHSVLSADPKWQQQLLALAKSKRSSICAAALRALASTTVDRDQLLLAARDHLAARDWPVRAAAMELLLATRHRQSPPLLFAMLDKESARMQEDVRTALRDLTGQQFVTLAEWQKWWSEVGATFAPRDPKTGMPGRDGGQHTVSYWNIAVRSERVVFVVDASGSMAQPFGTGNATRLQEAQRQLALVLEQLPNKAKANIIPFATDAELLFPKLQAIGKKQQKQAATFLAALEAKGPTNVHAALQAAFADAEVDTIFLLTDGRPSVGQIVAPEQLADEVQRWNLSRSIRIHTIAIGETSEFLARLAKDSGGDHRVAR